MDCRRARYFLVVSFDEPLAAEDQLHLAHHLKDCRACRHESFYYRELFSAAKQVSTRQPGADFNERLISEIRLREARSAWPVAESPRRSFRWPLVYVPALFGAVAALSFFAFLPEQPASTPAPVAAVTERAPEPAAPALSDRPRYVPWPRPQASPASSMMFEWPSATQYVSATGDPFRPLLVSQGSTFLNVRPRSQEQYVLPVVTQSVQRDRIY